MKFFGIPKSDLDGFWDHLEVLRWMIFRTFGVWTLVSLAAFSFKDILFDRIILPPLHSDFGMTQWLNHLFEGIGRSDLKIQEYSFQLINYDLTGQFSVHMQAAFGLGFLMAAPYFLLEIWRFIAPALYENERKWTRSLLGGGSLLFLAGVLTAYYMILPLTVNFLAGYQVSPEVANHISLQSYMGVMIILCLLMGVMFELPVLVFILSRLGLVSKRKLKEIRRYVIVLIVVMAGIITPTTDPFTMLLVATPLYLLYELSILFSRNPSQET